MKLIADSGGTKTTWKLITLQQEVFTYSTQGINAYFHTEESILKILQTELIKQIPVENMPQEIFFYGAGCAMAERKKMVSKALQSIFEHSKIMVEHDLLGACRALCGNEAGIVCILGTGSNACLYDGEKLISEEKSLGYILGDEGGGAYFGKLLVTAYLQDRLSTHISQAFADMFNLNRSTVLNHVYRSQYPNRYLAQFSKFLINHLDDEDCFALVFEGFADFIDRYVCTLPNYAEYTINCSGSVGFYYKQVLERVLWAKRMTLGKVVHTPMDGLVAYHI